MFHVEHHSSWRDVLIAGCSGFGILLDETKLSQLAIYLRELRHWNRRINLTGLEDPEDIAIQHFLDSLVGSKVLNSQIDVSLDIGTGAGFPGLPLKILFPSLPLTLLEPSSKKTAFLRHVIGTLGLTQVSVISKRVQDLVQPAAMKEHYAWVVTRAVNVSQILVAASVLLAPQGRLTLWRTKPLETELWVQGLRMTNEFIYTLPRMREERRLITLEMQ